MIRAYAIFVVTLLVVTTGALLGRSMPDPAHGAGHPVAAALRSGPSS